MAHIGKGLLLLAAVVGIIAGGVTWTMGMLGKSLVDTDHEEVAQLRREVEFSNAQAAAERKMMAAKMDSLLNMFSHQQEYVENVGLVACASPPVDAPDWLKLRCKRILEDAR